MTNFEKYKSEVLNLLNDFAVEKTTVRVGKCENPIRCQDCLFASDDGDCDAERLRRIWVYQTGRGEKS